MSAVLKCRFCEASLHHIFADLGMSPLSNAFLRADQLGDPETFYPLTAYVCENCFLVQLPAVQAPEHIFKDYVYFSSWSTSWLEHARRYAEQAVSRHRLGQDSRVIEIASNDGYLLQYFQKAGIPSLGVEPAANVAAKAVERGIDTVVDFFGASLARTLAKERGPADLLIGNNVLAHVPDINDFVAGLRLMLKPGGTVTLEFPHLLRLIEGCQYDTIYHEHFSYLSLFATERIFEAHGLTVVDVEQLPTHGGSLRVFVRHSGECKEPSDAVKDIRECERHSGLETVAAYTSFDERVRQAKRQLLSFLISARATGKRVAGYGAPAKGNTLLNYCGIRSDFIEFTVDRSPYKQGRFLPGTHIPVYDPQRIVETKPDYVLILPWNLKDEIISSMGVVRDWGGRFVIPIPDVSVIE